MQLPLTRNPKVTLTTEDFYCEEFDSPSVFRVWVWCKWMCATSVTGGWFDLHAHQNKLGTCLSVEAALTRLEASKKIRMEKIDGRVMVSIPPKPKKESTRAKGSRAPDALFDAVVRATQIDPTVGSNGGLLGKIVRDLKAAVPPYTPADVDDFALQFTKLCPWGIDSATKASRSPTPNEVARYIGKLREAAAPKRPGTKPGMTYTQMKEAGLI